MKYFLQRKRWQCITFLTKQYIDRSLLCYSNRKLTTDFFQKELNSKCILILYLDGSTTNLLQFAICDFKNYPQKQFPLQQFTKVFYQKVFSSSFFAAEQPSLLKIKLPKAERRYFSYSATNLNSPFQNYQKIFHFWSRTK